MKQALQSLKAKLPKDGRSKKMLKNIIAGFFIKGWSGVVHLLSVPLLIAVLGDYVNGLWMILSTILLQMDAFDLGLGNSLRNRLAEYVAKDEWEHARQAVTTTLCLITMIMIPLVIILEVALLFGADGYELLNANPAKVNDLNATLHVFVIFLGCNFIMKNIGSIYLGLQLPAVNNFLVVMGQTLGIAGVFILMLVNKDVTLLQVCLCCAGAPVLTYLLAFPVTFIKYPQLRPKIGAFRRPMVGHLFSKGINFFVLQASGNIIFLAASPIIANLVSPAAVTPFQVSNRYFSVVLMILSVIFAPMWSATTDAFTRRDFSWIRTSMNKLRIVVLCLLALLVLMVVVSPYVYRLWVGGKVEASIDFSLTILMGIYTFVLIYSLYYANVLYGIGRIRMQTYVTLAEAICFVPLALTLGSAMGLNGIVITLILVNIPCAITNKIQYEKIMSGRARGIWFK